MKDAEDEAFDEIARKQGMWGGGFPAKRAMAADKLQELVPSDAFERWWYYEGSAPPYTHHDCEEHTKRMCKIAWSNGADVAAQPAQKREWVGLTAEEIHDTEGYKETREMYRFAHAIEAKLKEKNNGT